MRTSLVAFLRADLKVGPYDAELRADLKVGPYDPELRS
jgi:hypothetical protein